MRALAVLAGGAGVLGASAGTAGWLATGSLFDQSGPFPNVTGAFAWIELEHASVEETVTGPEGLTWPLAPPPADLSGPRRWERVLPGGAWPLAELPLGSYTRPGVGSATLAGSSPGSVRLTQLSNLATLAIGQSVELAWSPPPGALATDRVIVRLRDDADGEVLWSSPGPESLAALVPSAGSVSLTIPPVADLGLEVLYYRAADRVQEPGGTGSWTVGTASLLALSRTVQAPATGAGVPQPEVVFPASGAVLTDRRPVVRITFPDPMWAGADAVAVGSAGEVPAPWQRWTTDRRTLVLGWNADLPDGTFTVLLNPPGRDRRLRRLDGVEVPGNTVATTFTLGVAGEGPQWVGRTPDREWKWGEEVVWEVVVLGQSLTYQWYRGEAGDRTQAWPSGQSARLEPGPMTTELTGWVEVTDGRGRTVSSDTLRAWLRASPPPMLMSFPTAYAAAPGGLVVLTLAAEDPDGLPWMADWFEGPPGNTDRWVGTGTRLERDALDSTQYWARLSNPVATANSPAAVVTVDPVTNAAQALQVWLAEAGVGRPDRQPESDPDRDGLSNLWEYALGGDPRLPWATGFQPWSFTRLGNGSLQGEVRLQVLDWPVGLELLTASGLAEAWQAGPTPAVTTEAGQRVHRWTWPAADPDTSFARWSIYLPFED